MIKLIYEAKELSPKQECNKVLSMLRKYAKENDHYMTIEKFSTGDNSGDLILYFTTNRYDYNSDSVKFMFQIGYAANYSTDFKPEYLVGWLAESEGPDFGSKRFDYYKDMYDFILDYIIEYGNIIDKSVAESNKTKRNSNLKEYIDNSEDIYDLEDCFDELKRMERSKKNMTKEQYNLFTAAYNAISNWRYSNGSEKDVFHSCYKFAEYCKNNPGRLTIQQMQLVDYIHERT